jgi:response regulator RpfG family c-di-GMP phosphodiesterase
MSTKTDLLFSDETEKRPDPRHPDLFAPPPWKILVVDDEHEVQQSTLFTLKHLVFFDRPFRFFSAYSAEEAKEILNQHPDIAVILLDVVMEQENSGLLLVKYIREKLRNRLVRIILRTGQPGQAPEQEVVLDYDINDYREKTELTSRKLHTSVISALRSFRSLQAIAGNLNGLEMILGSLHGLHEIQSIDKLAAAALTQLIAILHLQPDTQAGHIAGFAAAGRSLEDFRILAANGEYQQYIGSLLWDRLPPDQQHRLSRAILEKRSIFFEDSFVVYSCIPHGAENLIYLEGLPAITGVERQLVEIFCLNTSTAFDNVYLNREIEDTQKEILFMLGEVAERRSKETGQHVKRVAEYARLLAFQLGLSASEQELIWLASSTHDIGKLAVPDAILNKPGKLTLAEFEVIKQHTRAGYEMLRKAEHSIMRAGAIIALEHHEHWDGNGYPDMKKSEQIHIFARITAIADVFDALCHDRVYKTAWPLADVLSYLREQSGKRFDPHIVGIFLNILPEILRIKNSHPNK